MFKVVPKRRDDEGKTLHRVRLPNGGPVLPESGDEIAEVTPYWTQRKLAGEVEITELKDESPAVPDEPAPTPVTHEEQ